MLFIIMMKKMCALQSPLLYQLIKQFPHDEIIRFGKVSLVHHLECSRISTMLLLLEWHRNAKNSRFNGLMWYVTLYHRVMMIFTSIYVSSISCDNNVNYTFLLFFPASLFYLLKKDLFPISKRYLHIR